MPSSPYGSDENLNCFSFLLGLHTNLTRRDKANRNGLMWGQTSMRVHMKEEKHSSKQINSLEQHGTEAPGKVCSIGLNRSLLWSSLASDRKLSEHKHFGSMYRLCPTKLVDMREVNEEWERALEVRSCK